MLAAIFFWRREGGGAARGEASVPAEGDPWPDRPRLARPPRRHPDDEEDDAGRLADKVRALRIFADDAGRMNGRSASARLLCVSQFTLYGDARKGRRPAFVAAARPEEAEPLYERFCARPAPGAARSAPRWTSSWSTTGP